MKKSKVMSISDELDNMETDFEKKIISIAVELWNNYNVVSNKGMEKYAMCSAEQRKMIEQKRLLVYYVIAKVFSNTLSQFSYHSIPYVLAGVDKDRLKLK